MKKFRNYIIFLGVLPSFINLSMYSLLPKKIPIHSNIFGEIDNYQAKSSIFIISIVILIVAILFALLMKYYITHDAMYGKDNLKVSYTTFCTVLLMLNLINIYFIFECFNPILASVQYAIFTIFIGVFISVVGFLVKKSKRNRYFGITFANKLNSDDEWRKINIKGGNALIFSGLLIILSAIFNSFICIFIIIGLSVINFIYFLTLSKRKNIL